MKFSYCFYLLITGLLLGSCIDPVTIVGPSVPSSLVVEGWFTNDINHNYVKLSRSATFSGEAYNSPVSGAIITLFNEEGHLIDKLPETAFGFYQIRAEAEPGSSYRLQIIIGDSIYNSNIETVPHVTGIQGFEVDMEERDKLVGSRVETETTVRQLYFDIHATISTPEDRDNYLLWKTSGIYEFTSIPFNNVECAECLCWAPDLTFNKNVNVLSDRDFNGNEFRHTVATVEFDRNTRYLLTVEQYAINEGAFEYWNSILEQQTNTGSIFDPAPRRIRSNILPEDSGLNEVFGYFTTAFIVEEKFMLDRSRVAGENGLRPMHIIEAIEGDCRVQVDGASSERPPGF